MVEPRVTYQGPAHPEAVIRENRRTSPPRIELPANTLSSVDRGSELVRTYDRERQAHAGTMILGGPSSDGAVSHDEPCRERPRGRRRIGLWDGLDWSLAWSLSRDQWSTV
jgi:hypothetical protein